MRQCAKGRPTPTSLLFFAPSRLCVRPIVPCRSSPNRELPPQDWKSATLLTNCSVPPAGRPQRCRVRETHRKLGRRCVSRTLRITLLSAGLLFSSVQRPATGLPSLPVQHTTPQFSVAPIPGSDDRCVQAHTLLFADLLFSSVQRPATGLPSLPVQHTTPRSARNYSHGNGCKSHASFDLRRSASLQPNRPNANIVALLHEIFSPSAALTPRGACQENDARTRRAHRTGNTYLR
jgi:hypothetical protein